MDMCGVWLAFFLIPKVIMCVAFLFVDLVFFLDIILSYSMFKFCFFPNILSHRCRLKEKEGVEKSAEKEQRII